MRALTLIAGLVKRPFPLELNGREGETDDRESHKFQLVTVLVFVT